MAFMVQQTGGISVFVLLLLLLAAIAVSLCACVWFGVVVVVVFPRFLLVLYQSQIFRKTTPAFASLLVNSVCLALFLHLVGEPFSKFLDLKGIMN